MYMNSDTRGSFSAGRGDLCGARYAEGLASKKATPDAVRNTRNALIDEPIELVKVPGGATYAIPRVVYNFLAQGNL